MRVILDGLEFDASQFAGLGHTTTLPATTGASGAAYPAEARFPNRVFRAALNQLGQGLYSASTSSVAIGTGSKVFTLATSVQITDGAFVLITDQSNDANFMYGQVTNVTGLVYTVNVTATGGSGTIAAWNFQVSGVRGAAGSVSDGDKGDITVTGGNTWTIDSGAVTEAKQTLVDNTTNDVSITKHGYTPKAPNDATKFLNGLGAWAVPPSEALPIISSTYYPQSNVVGGATDSINFTINRLQAYPVYIPATVTALRIAINVTVSAAGSVRLGIYSDTNGAPNALILDAGTISVSTTGLKEITISQSLTKGWYWLAHVSDVAATLSAYPTTAIVPILGVNGGGDVLGVVYKAHTFGVLPSPFGGSITYNTFKPVFTALRF